MTIIQIDDKTASALESIAKAKGLTVEEYLRGLVEENERSATKGEGEAFDKELTQLSFDGPTLPAGFSRADIYVDEER